MDKIAIFFNFWIVLCGFCGDSIVFYGGRGGTSDRIKRFPVGIELFLEENMKLRWPAVIAGAAVVFLAASYGANAAPADGGLRHDQNWDHPRDGGRHHDHPWDHARGGLNAIGSSESAGASSAGPSGAPAPLLAAGIPAFALIGGAAGARGLMQAFRRRKA